MLRRTKGSRAGDIRLNGSGDVVSVQFNGEPAPQAGTARLLGSSSAFVFLWWPQQQRAEALPIAAIKRLQAQPRASRVPLPAQTHGKPEAGVAR